MAINYCNEWQNDHKNSKNMYDANNIANILYTTIYVT